MQTGKWMERVKVCKDGDLGCFYTYFPLTARSAIPVGELGISKPEF